MCRVNIECNAADRWASNLLRILAVSEQINTFKAAIFFFLASGSILGSPDTSSLGNGYEISNNTEKKEVKLLQQTFCNKMM